MNAISPIHLSTASLCSGAHSHHSPTISPELGLFLCVMTDRQNFDRTGFGLTCNGGP